jgi:hypothetical protein
MARLFLAIAGDEGDKAEAEQALGRAAAAPGRGRDLGILGAD